MATNLMDFLVGIGLKSKKETFAEVKQDFQEVTQEVEKTKTAVASVPPAMEKVSGGATRAAAKIFVFREAVRLVQTGINRFVMGVAKDLQELSYTSERLETPIDELSKLQYQAEMTGSSAQNMTSALEKLSRAAGQADFQPKGFAGKAFKELGINVRDANGDIKNTSDLLTEIGKKMQGLDKSKQIALGQKMGLDRRTVHSITQNLEEIGAEYDKMRQISGLSMEDAAKNARDFMQEVNRFKLFMGMIHKAVLSDFMVAMKNGFADLRKWVLDNAEAVKKTIQGIVIIIQTWGMVLGGMFRVITRNIGIMVDWWERLEDKQKDIIQSIGLVAGALYILNTALKMGPLGQFIMLMTALLLLLDDYQVWAEGGESAFDWKAVDADIIMVSDAISAIIKGTADAFAWLKDSGTAIQDIWSGAVQWVSSYIDILAKLFGWLRGVESDEFTTDAEAGQKMLEGMSNTLRGLLGLFFDLGGAFLAAFGIDATSNVQAFQEAIENVVGIFEWLVLKLADAVAGVKEFWAIIAGEKEPEVYVPNLSEDEQKRGFNKESISQMVQDIEESSPDDESRRKTYQQVIRSLHAEGKNLEADALSQDWGQHQVNKRMAMNSQIEPTNIVSPSAAVGGQTTQNVNNTQDVSINVEQTNNVYSTDPEGAANEIARDEERLARQLKDAVVPHYPRGATLAGGGG